MSLPCELSAVLAVGSIWVIPTSDNHCIKELNCCVEGSFSASKAAMTEDALSMVGGVESRTSPMQVCLLYDRKRWRWTRRHSSSAQTLHVTSYLHIFTSIPSISAFNYFIMERMKRPNIKFRVLIIGRANAGKTSILQRVCDTTESPKIYRKISPSLFDRGDWVCTTSNHSLQQCSTADLIILLVSTETHNGG